VAAKTHEAGIRYVAFLRGLNVGGHTVKMEQLRQEFEALDFSEVSTFIASGNVLFSTDEADSATLERRIEAALHKALGYDVATFLRTEEELARIAAYRPFAEAPAYPTDTSYVVFLQTVPEAALRDRILALSNEQDLLHLHDRELYWLRRGSLLGSAISEKDWRGAYKGALTTARNLNTVQRIAAKLASAKR
jgi:uncharacterized protein (DUF1697 family)